jgi:Flp pilus assembly protein TadB
VSPLLLAAATLAALAVGLAVPTTRRSGARADQRPGTRTVVRIGASGWSRGDLGPGPDGHAKGTWTGQSVGPGQPWAHGSGPGSGTTPLTVRAVSCLAGVAVWLLLGGPVGAALGVVVAVVLPLLIARLEPARVRRERLELIGSAPLVADLLSAALLAGVPLEHAIPVVARAIGGAAGDCLMAVHRRVELGEPVTRAWAGLAAAPGLGGVARAVARSGRTGAPLAALLAQSAEDLRTQASAAALAEVRATGVRAVLPLGLCLLPAFALLGIAPIVGGLLPSP